MTDEPPRGISSLVRPPLPHSPNPVVFLTPYECDDSLFP